MKYLFLIFLISSYLSMALLAQGSQDSLPEYGCIYFIEDEPDFPGGDSVRRVFIKSNLQYPDTAKQYHVEGVVYTSFIVEKDGSLTSFQVLRGIGWACDEEAIRVLKLMPNWEPASRRGVPIRAQMFMPIRFKMNDTIYKRTKPQFPGGQDSLKAFIRGNINYGKLNPDEMKREIVHLNLLIDQNGTIVGSSLIMRMNSRTVGGGCEEEALRIVRKMPTWIPAKCGDKSVPSSYILEMRFVGN